MRKLTIWLLCALMALSSLGALAQDYTLDRKLQLQLLNGSGLSATATLTASPGLNMTALDSAGNAMLQTLLPGSVLDLQYIRSTSVNKSQEDLSLNLRKNGNVAANIRYSTDGILESLQSSLLGAQSLVSLRGDGRLASLLTGGALSQWPGLERALYAMQFSDNAWRARAEAALKPYLDKLSLWLQGYTRITTTQVVAQTITVNTISVPASAFKSYVKQLLGEAYQDTALLSLLREQFTASEILAYLQPAMLPGFHQAIDRLPLTGDISILRHFDARGVQILDEWKLPMAGAKGLKQISYRNEHNATSGEGVSTVTLEYLPRDATRQTGAVTVLSFRGGRPADAQVDDYTLSYTGSLSHQPEQAEGFTVSAQSAAPASVVDFNFYLNAAKENYDEATKISTQDYEITLLLKPQNMPTLNDQSIKLTAQLNSALGDSKATRFTGQLVWQDLGTQGSITADISGSSVAPWVIPSVNTQGALRLDSLSPQQLASQRTQLQLSLTAALAALARSMIVPGK